MERLSRIIRPVEAELERFQQFFNGALDSPDPLLKSALEHIKQRRGKMMRPILVFLTAKWLGKVTDATFYSAVALELLHTASLVHDDVVDESDERRGQASVNALYGNKVSVLVGDYLLATCLMHASHTKSGPIVEAVARLGQNLSEGEILQLSNIDNVSFDESVYFDIIRKKTSALFATCTQAAALSAGVAAGDVEKARLLGEYIGICFQIRDDIFDYFNDPQIGKPTGNDLREGKLTLPALYALNRSGDKEAARLAQRVKQGLATDDEIAWLVDFVKREGGIEYASRAMQDYKGRAAALVAGNPSSDVAEALLLYIDYVVDRAK